MVMVKNFISALMSAISNCSLYAKDHASVDEFTRKSLKILEKLLKEWEKFEIMLIEDDLVINKTSFKEIGLQVENLKKRMKRKGLSQIEFLPKVTFEEMRQFISEILETDKKCLCFLISKQVFLIFNLKKQRWKIISIVMISQVSSPNRQRL
jgi:NCAIR mutase (PurE)-related protein